ncbi:MAG: hypothetical protein KBB01_04070 [Candidatus Omnitrophica bacterium]|jgi:hypothetical protein|nr:hypothetical protein [Candidatus Omnitrophota bacterium]
MKKKLILIIICFLALVVFCALRDFVIKQVITLAASNITGAPTRIGGFSLSIIRQSVKITNFKMYSPKDFPPDVMVDIPLLGVSYDILPLIRGKIHLKELTLDLKEMGLIKNEEGKLNVDSLKLSEPKDKPDKPAKPVKQMSIQMDLVNLNIGRVVSKDYSVSGPTAIKVYDIGIKKTYKNINSAQQLAALIIAEPLKAAGIQGLGIYGASVLTGVAALPVAAVFTFAGKDYARSEYNVSWEKAYEVSLSILKTSGAVKKEDKTMGIINAEVGNSKVTLKLKKVTDKKTEITVSARKYMLPQPEVAAGIIYSISGKLK